MVQAPDTPKILVYQWNLDASTSFKLQPLLLAGIIILFHLRYSIYFLLRHISRNYISLYIIHSGLQQSVPKTRHHDCRDSRRRPHKSLNRWWARIHIRLYIDFLLNKLRQRLQILSSPTTPPLITPGQRSPLSTPPRWPIFYLTAIS